MHTSKHKTETDHSAPETAGNVIRWGQHYDALVRLMTLGTDKRIREKTAEMAGIKPGDHVLDVGCGTGELTFAAKARAGSAGLVCGVDASPEMIEAAHAKTVERGIEIDFRIGLIEALPFADDSFDIVLSSLMMHHLPDDVKRQGLSEIYRVLKPGGRLLVVDIQRPTTVHNRLLMALMLHPKVETGVQDLPAMMAAAGFSHVETGGARFFPMLGYARGEVSR